MTREEALQIPELQIFPNGLVEDVFYYKMALAGKLSKEEGQKALERLKGKKSDPCYKGAFMVADMMIANIEKYGIPCAGWVE
jgi:hypothetical protein